MGIKHVGKTFLSRLLEAQVKQLRRKNDFKVVAVVGSVGKTTTKLAIAKMLQPQIKLQHQAGNYNDRLTVPLVFFGQNEPGIYNVLAWLKVLLANQRMLRQDYPYEMVLLELGSDGPGQMQRFAYVAPDLVVVTALTDEHMAYFKTLDAVAHEELLATSFSKQTLINIDDSPAQYLQAIDYLAYGTNPKTDFALTKRQLQATGDQQLQLTIDGTKLSVTAKLLGEQGAKSVLAAAAVGNMLGLTNAQIIKNVSAITAVPGRMAVLKGVQKSIIIDDSYNASPVAVTSALDVLYAMPNKQRIAVLGNMNEMGDLSPQMHTNVGNYCDPSKLAMVVTIGTDARDYLAPAAAAKGCRVTSFTSPYDAGQFVLEQLQPNAAILVKGSQNGVFSEETVKLLLADSADTAHLVRQSNFWLRRKRQQFRVS